MGLGVLALVGAWTIRQTQGATLAELYRWLTLPLQPQAEQQQAILENAQLSELQQRLIELDAQNQELQRLLNYTQAQTGEGIVAPVIGRSADRWWEQIVVGRGREHGIRIGSVVSGTGGIVGRVIQVTPNTSRVLLVSDPTSQVGATVSRSRVMGFMRGRSGSQAVMEFFEKDPNVQPGDVVATSPYSQLFPPGLPIGRVVSIDFEKSPAPEAVIELAAPVDYLEWVTITTSLEGGANP
jgi:rod shape-determining protein MreC